MKLKTTLLTLIPAIALALTGCSTLASKIGKLPPINGMIFDMDNKPVVEAILSIDEKDIAVSDIQGHFTIPSLKPLEPTILTAKKKNYETTSIEFSYSDAGQILYFRMISAEQLIQKAEKAIADKSWKEANDFLKRAESIGGDITTIKYLEAIVQIEKKDFKGAEETLVKLFESNSKSPFILLFLADLYEYRLSNPDKAIALLEGFLQYRNDKEIETRLSNLRNAQEIKSQ